MTNFEIGSLIFDAIGTVSIIFLIVQLCQTKKQNKEMHEEQRRIQTVNVLMGWNNGIKKESRIAEKIVDKLSSSQCVMLYDYIPFEVSKETHDMICQMCSRQGASCKKCRPNRNGKYLISGIQLTELRGNVTNYLNNLEIVAEAWKQAIVDREELEFQFSFLYVPGKKSALSTYREIAGGGQSYPALNEFYKTIESNSKKTTNKKEEQ